MKIVVGGSMTFAKEQLQVKDFLERKGHTVLVTDDINHFVNSKSSKDNVQEHILLTIKYDAIKEFFKKIEESDAYVVCNYPKRGIKGYLGTSVLMELGLAYHLGKKIFLLYDFDRSQNYTLEVTVINPVILNGNLDKIQ